MGVIRKPYVLQICGYKNTGKTTFVNELIKYLKEFGYSVGTIKHDGHDFETQNFSEDNFQHFDSGAEKSLVFSKNKWLFIERKEKELDDLIELMMDMDVVIVEGCKNSELFKIELLRKGVSEAPVSNPTNRLGVYADFEYSKERSFKRGEREIYDFILEKIREFRRD